MDPSEMEMLSYAGKFKVFLINPSLLHQANIKLYILNPDFASYFD